VAAGDRTVLGPLAAWLHAHPPRRISEDLVQKLLITLCRLMSSERGRSLLKGANSIPDFLASIASRHSIDERRAEIRLRHVVKDIASSSSSKRTQVDPLFIMSQAEVRKAIFAGFARLSPFEREAIVRSLVFGQSYRTIANSMFGRSRGVRDEQRLRKLVCRARAKLQARLGSLRFT
jgi:DNA-directed RNA polymerase specialized sigma24 family protein